MPKGLLGFEPIGQAFGRPDLERIGIFAELGYLVGARYTPIITQGNCRDLKKRQMFPGGTKLKAGLQDCYFDQEYKRIFIGEGYPRKRKDSDKKSNEIRKAFVPPHYPNPLYYRGDAFGTFSGVYEEFSPKKKPRIKPEKEPRGIYTNPGKLGGPGYANIALSPYPEYICSKYEPKDKPTAGDLSKKQPFQAGQYPNYIDPNPFYTANPIPPHNKLKEVYTKRIITFRPSHPAKLDGGCKAGTISSFPQYIEDRYHDPHRIDKLLDQVMNKRRGKQKSDTKYRGVLKPPACCKTLQTPSVMLNKVNIATNNDNWRTMKPITFSKTFAVL